MSNAGYIEIESKKLIDDILLLNIIDLTLKGHKTYTALREPTTWEKVKLRAKSAGTHVLDIVEDVIKDSITSAAVAATTYGLDKMFKP